MITLGIHDGHGASACIMVDGKLRAFVQEERFTRLKNDYGYPIQAIEFCLAELGIEAKDLDCVAFASTTMHALNAKLKSICNFTNEDWIRIHKEYWHPKLFEGRDVSDAFDWIADDPRFQNVSHYYDFSQIGIGYNHREMLEAVRNIRLDGLKRHLDIHADKVTFCDHHACHAYYSLFGSHIRDDRSLVFTLDGGGDGTTSTLFQFLDGSLKEIARSNGVDIARLYREITLIMGMKLGEHEYKVMGLAPYATNREATKSWRVFENMFEIRDDLIAYAEGKKLKDHYFSLKDAFEGHRFDGIAAAVQRLVEETAIAWVTQSAEKYGARKAVAGGGTAMNVKANMLIAEQDILDDFYVCPSPGDDTLSIGASYMVEAATSANAWERLHPIDDVYQGPSYGQADAEDAIRKRGTNQKFSVKSNLEPEAIAAFLAEGKVVARCSGPMEFGARALGNRSILADPRSRRTVEKINHQIKYRDFWMPFAPVVLADRANDYLQLEGKGIRRDYMMIGARTTKEGAEALAAATHAGDDSARPQVLVREKNPGYYDIVKAFEAQTGVGALLNTSFNLHGEPIACTPDDAISVFERSELDGLLLDDILITRAVDGETKSP